jgi:hypothetical protein
VDRCGAEHSPFLEAILISHQCLVVGLHEPIVPSFFESFIVLTFDPFLLEHSRLTNLLRTDHVLESIVVLRPFPLSLPPPQALGPRERGVLGPALFWSWRTTKFPRAWRISPPRERRGLRPSPLERSLTQSFTCIPWWVPFLWPLGRWILGNPRFSRLRRVSGAKMGSDTLESSPLFHAFRSWVVRTCAGSIHPKADLDEPPEVPSTVV